MKHLFVFLLFIQVFLASGQVIQINGKKVNCGDAYTNLEFNLCSKYVVDSLNKIVIQLNNQIEAKIDTLILDSKKHLNKGDSLDIVLSQRDFNHCKRLKNNFEKSKKSFRQMVESERNLLGEIYNEGRERTMNENSVESQHLEHRIKHLSYILETFF